MVVILTLDARIRFRDELRAGRARTLRNGEAFAEIVRVIERLGRFLGAKGLGMGHFQGVIAALACESVLAEEIPLEHSRHLDSFTVLYESTRINRNLSVHEGAYARNVARHAVELALILEDAMQTTLQTTQHFMVRSPVCAELWEPVAFVRQKMLVNAFSFLPVFLEGSGEWMLVSDVELAKYLRNGDRKNRLARKLEDASADGLNLLPAATVSPGESILSVAQRLGDRPLVVISDDRPQEILGVITAFDLL